MLCGSNRGESWKEIKDDKTWPNTKKVCSNGKRFRKMEVLSSSTPEIPQGRLDNVLAGCYRVCGLHGITLCQNLEQ